jgi:putative hydrolase of the HAD superfamily
MEVPLEYELSALVFDLAGVLLDFGGPESVHKLSDGRIGDEDFFRFWSDAKCAHDFHCGRCTPEEFARQAVRELGLRVTPERFLAEYQTWLLGPYPGALELLERLRPQYRVACLSNTDAVNVRKFDEELQLQNWFDECFYSNEMGLRKRLRVRLKPDTTEDYRRLLSTKLKAAPSSSKGRTIRYDLRHAPRGARDDVD